MAVDVLYVAPEGAGYHPVSHMAHLAAELFGGDLVTIPAARAGKLQRLLTLAPRRRHDRAGIVICPHPAALAAILAVDDWRKRYGTLVAWVFDSFWYDHIPRYVRFPHVFDAIHVTELEDIAHWRARTGMPVAWLPWGCDALGLGSGDPRRPVDLLRFGRQPGEWEDDEATERHCTAANLSFQGRPPFAADPHDGERALMAALGSAKFTLSFSNRVSPSAQTHPRREYVTGRWTDALAAGAIVAGVPPRSETARSLLWEGALLDLGTIDRARGLAAIADAAQSWTPVRARINHLRSLETLDWRWRFEKLAGSLGVQPPALTSSLAALRQTIETQRRSLR